MIASTGHAAPGDLLWESTVTPRSNVGAVLSQDGQVFLAGYAVPQGLSRRRLVAAFDAGTGVLQWQDLSRDDNEEQVAWAVRKAGDQLYTGGWRTPVGGTIDALVHGYRASDGRVLWQFSHRGAKLCWNCLGTTPDRTVAAGYVETAVNNHTLILSNRASDGNLLWRDDRSPSDEAFVRAMIVSGNDVIVSGYVQDLSSFGVVDFVRVLSAQDGRTRWQVHLTETSGDAAIAAGQGAVFRLQARETASENFTSLGRYDLRTGELLWQQKLPTLNVNRRALAQSGRYVVLAASTGTQCSSVSPDPCKWVVEAYDVRDGTRQWSYEAPFAGLSGALPEHIAIDQDRVAVAGTYYLSTGETEWVVDVMDAATGKLLWRDRHRARGRYAFPTMLQIDGNLLVVAGSADDSNGVGHCLVRAYQLH